MNKIFLARHQFEQLVEFTTTYNFSGIGHVVVMGNGKLGISSGKSIFPGSDIKSIKRMENEK